MPAGYGVIVGNCQAESLRVVLDADDRPILRVPPVYELTADETRRLHELLGAARFLVAQPVRDDYHGLPLGTRQLRASLPSSARTALFTPVRFAGLYPFQASLHVPGVEEVPPIVGYHDIRTLAAAAGLPVPDRVATATVHAIADDSLAELRRREENCDVAVADLLRPIAAHLRTINHPANAIWTPLAARVLDALGLPGEPKDPGRPLLDGVHAPREAWVTAAWGDRDGPQEHWIIEGRTVDVADVRDAHRRWYARHPLFVAGAIDRLSPLLRRWRAG